MTSRSALVPRWGRRGCGYPSEFRWKEPPYEYVHVIEDGPTIEAIQESWREALDAFRDVRRQYLLY